MFMEKKLIRLSKAAREFNVGLSTIVEFLHKKGITIDASPNMKISPEAYELLAKEYSTDLSIKKKSEEFSLKNFREPKESISLTEDIKATETGTFKQEEEVFIKDMSRPAVKLEEEGTTIPEPPDRKSTRLNSSHTDISRMPSSA